MAQIDAVVIGASAGGIEALSTIIRRLPADLCAAVLIVVHTRAEGRSCLDRVLARGSLLPLAFARDDVPVEPGRIYVAPPDLHLTVDNRVMQLVHGPKENGFRPAVDPLFRSAARAFGSHVMGIILSGALDDGTYGLKVIKNAGGIAVVQDPDEAPHPQMALSAMRFVSVDHVLRVTGIASLLVESCKSEHRAKGVPVMARREPEPQNPSHETDIKEMEYDFGLPSGLTCPDCGGALWEVRNGELTRYRCHVGHQFTTESLDAQQADAVEGALWSAVRVLEEHADLRKRMAQRAEAADMAHVAAGFSASADASQRQAHTIRQLLFGSASPSLQPSSPGPVSRERKAKKAKKVTRAR